MKAIRVEQYGGPEVLKMLEIETPKPGPGSVLVRVMMAGVNFVDIYHRRGFYPMQLPFTPGLEASGVVQEIGEGVTNVKVGDRVAYTGEPGAYAEASMLPSERLIPLPDDFTFEQGAAFPLQGMTAHYLIHEFRKPKPGDIVLIHAAAGGMGLLLTQWARHLGARVIGTVSTEEKAKIAKEAGATDVVLYSQTDFVAETKHLTNGHGADLIIDGVGKTTFLGDLEAVALRGHIVVYGSASGPADPISANSLQPRSITISGASSRNYLRTREELMHRASDVIDAIRGGWLRLRIDRTFPLKNAAEAHGLLERRETIGKIQLMIN